MSKSALLKLAECVDAANEKDRELDALVCIALNVRPDWAKNQDGRLVSQRTGWVSIGAHGPGWDALPYMSSLDAAATLIPPGFSFALGDLNKENCPWACVTSPDGVDFTSDGALTPTCCLVAACLRARANQEKTNAR